MESFSSDTVVSQRGQSGRIAPHAVPLEKIVEFWATDAEKGLTTAEVAHRLVQYGYNELVEPPASPLWRKFLGQFREPVVWVLMVAAMLSGAIGVWADGLAILAIVLLNALPRFY